MPTTAEPSLFILKGNTYAHRGKLSLWAWDWNHDRAKGVWSKLITDESVLGAIYSLSGVRVYRRTENGDVECRNTSR